MSKLKPLLLWCIRSIQEAEEDPAASSTARISAVIRLLDGCKMVGDFSEADHESMVKRAFAVLDRVGKAQTEKIRS